MFNYIFIWYWNRNNKCKDSKQTPIHVSFHGLWFKYFFQMLMRQLPY